MKTCFSILYLVLKSALCVLTMLITTTVVQAYVPENY